MKRERPTTGVGSRQPLLKLPTAMPDGTKIRKHPLIHLLDSMDEGEDNKSDIARALGVKPQSFYKWERLCRADRHFPLPVLRAVQLAQFFNVKPGLFRPDAFKE